MRGAAQAVQPRGIAMRKLFSKYILRRWSDGGFGEASSGLGIEKDPGARAGYRSLEFWVEKGHPGILRFIYRIYLGAN